MDNYVGYKFKLYPTPEQIKKFNQYFGYARFVYNLGIDVYNHYYHQVKDDDNIKYKNLSFYQLNNEITRMKNDDKSLEWMKQYDSTCGKLVLQDVIQSYRNFYDRVTKKPPKYKSKKNHWKSFPVRKERMSIFGNCLNIPGFRETILVKNVPEKIQGFGNQSTAKRTPENRRGEFRNFEYKNYINPRVVYNGVDYFITFSLEMNDVHKPASCDRFIDNEIWNHKPYTDIVGIDLGTSLSNWLVCSNNMTLKRPNQSKLDKRIAGYQRKFSRQQRINNKTIERTNQYTKNEQKTLDRWNKLSKKHTNQRLNLLHGFVNDIIETKPEAVVIEDLSYTEMIETAFNKPMVKNITDAIPYTTKCIITYKCEANSIPVIVADRGFKSTQTCSNCGHEQKMGSRRIYKCPVCGMRINRDLNSSYNLRNYGYAKLYPEKLVYCNVV